ncbi:hypothetical protein GCM10009425_09050 [Pseudomonas asuensis]|jgi:hypothetical protein|uniref:Uncharacterized protein n=1 Tax=Pseudomonas asuensis TaxID=1825787 RepID=A0ABQ2GKX9_9PSED|nr:hypothetical protein [Pseudomonas asuensis]GGM00126.1 hypothetical protein GCM10009425_09050 [Pseudomonas asuensis]
MSITFKKSVAVLADQVTVEEAETLLEWLVKNPSGKVNLGDLEHLHTANLQVLMALKPSVSVWPKNTDIKLWLEAAFNA